MISTVDDKGSVVAGASLPTSRSAVARYFTELPDLLEQEDVPLTLAHAKFVKAIAYAKVKTDKVDTLTLAQLLRADLIPRAHMVSPELQPLRDLLRARLHLVEKRTSAKNSVQRLLEKYNVTGPAELPEGAVFQACL